MKSIAFPVSVSQRML